MKTFRPNVIAFYSDVARELKSINSAIFFQQICYWTERATLQDGWFYKSANDFQKETTLTEKMQRISRNDLLKIGWIEAEKRMYRGSMVWHYRAKYTMALALNQPAQKPVGTSEPTSPKASCTTSPKASSSITEITTETTSMGEGEGREEEREITGSMVNEGIGLFRGVNPTFDTLYKNNTERGAMKRLLKRWNMNQLRLITEKVLPKVNANRYAKGKSITPLELERNMGYLKAYIDQHNSRTIKSV